MEKRWNILTAADVEINALHATLGINKTLCKILVQREIKTFDEAKNFFRPQLSQLHDPFLMKDMRKAVERISSAISNLEKILVFGDYDVDGTTSVALMYSFLIRIYQPGKIEYYVPHRYKEGYGISKAGIDYAKSAGFKLIISLDCGIKSVDLISYAKDLGLDFIVCDHHLPDKILPPAIAILNPKQEGCNYPYKELCGCGVGFKLVTAMCKFFNLHDNYFLSYIDLVVTAIAADIVPITGENRTLAYFGLKKINQDPCAGLKSLLNFSGVTQPLTITNVVFVIAPRINAAGRMDDAKKAVQLFIEQDERKANELAAQLQSDNLDRKKTDISITEEALSIIKDDIQMINRKSTVIFRSHWHKGVVGIVASRLIENYYRPTVVLTQSGDIVAGSARSVSGFNLYEAIHACKEHLLGYGGHFAAAGLTMLPECVNDFSNKFEQTVSELIEPHLLIPEIIIDTELPFYTITKSYCNIINQMEPFGPGNTKPIFLTRNISDTGYSKIVKDIHIKFVVTDGNTILTGIGFNLANKFNLLTDKKPFDILYALEENEWNNEKRIQLKVIDIRPYKPNVKFLEG